MRDLSRERLRLSLEAEGRRGLVDLLEAGVGGVIGGRIRVDRLLAIGRQSFVFAATDLLSGGLLALKQPPWDYREPLGYSRADVARARDALRVEHRVLSDCRSGHLPRPAALLVEPSVVPAGRESNVLGADEVFLAEELIDGRVLSDAALLEWPGLDASDRERMAGRIALEFVVFWRSLRDAGWHYGDISPTNLMLEHGTDRLRLVDAGSAVPASEHVTLCGFTPAFTTPRIYHCAQRGSPLPGDLSTALPMLGKVLAFALSRKEPANGGLPDLGCPELSCYSDECREALAEMLRLDADPADASRAVHAVERWTAREGH